MTKLVNLLYAALALGLSLLALAGCPVPQDESPATQSATNTAPTDLAMKTTSPVAAVVGDGAEAVAEPEPAEEEAEAGDEAGAESDEAADAESVPADDAASGMTEALPVAEAAAKGCEDCGGGECSGACVEAETVVEPEPADTGDEGTEAGAEDEGGGCGSEGGCASCAQSATGAAPAEVPAGLARATLRVEGMTCVGKAGWVGKTIGGLEGVAGCYADEGTLTAVIDFDPGMWDADGLIAEIEQRSEGVFEATQV